MLRFLKNLLLWILGVAFGVGLLLGAVLGVSWYFTGESDLPETGAVTFGGAALSENGWLWQVPLIGGVADRVLYNAPNLTVQALEEMTDAHPALTLPAWATDAQLTITADDTNTAVFTGTAAEYESFAFSANGSYTAVLRAWHLPAGMAADALASGTKAVVLDPGLEAPAQPTGWYSYRFRFTLAANPAVTLSSDSVRQGGTLCLLVTGVLGTEVPAADTDLGTVSFERTDAGWRGYLGAAYNAETGVHTVTLALGAQTITAEVTVAGRQFGTAEVAAETDDEAANTEFRNAIWPLYTAASGAKQWAGAWLCPVDYSGILVDYGAVKTVNGKAVGRANSALLATAAGTQVSAPANGTVVFAGALTLTGNTVVIDHGCGVRTFLYGLGEIGTARGSAVTRGSAVGTAGDTLTVDVKIGSKSICPWDLFQGSGGLFWKEGNAQ